MKWLKTERSKNIFLTIYLFLILYAPPILKNINTLLLVFVFSVILLLKYYQVEVLNFFKNKQILKLGIGFLIYFLWYLITILINSIVYNEAFISNLYINLYSMGLVIIISFVCVLFLLIYAEKNKITFDRLIKLAIYAGAIQGIICILSFLIPSFKSFLLNLLYFLTNDELFKDSYHVSRRFYGYSNGMVDAYGFGSGIIACLPLFYSLNHSKRNLLYLIFLLPIVILNSRTGLVIFAIGVVVWLIELIVKKKLKEYKKVMIYSLIAFVVTFFVILLIHPITIEWIVTDFLSFFNKNYFGTADILFSNNFWRTPGGIRNIIGAGYSIAGFGGMTDILGFSSDVGYINEIWRTGFIGMAILLITIFRTHYVIATKDKSKNFAIITFFLISLLVGNIKLVIFIYNPGIIIMLMYVLYELAYADFHRSDKKLSGEIYSVNQDDKISIIVPVYNVEKYLSKCLDSLINQSYRNLEIVLINDGSTDNSLRICQEYAQKDERIKVISKENEGQAIARNYGLDVITGKYVGFVDSDDWIDLDTYDFLHYLINKYHADCSFVKIRKKDYSYQSDYYEEDLYANDDILVEYLRYGMRTGEYSLCSYLFSAKQLENLRFPIGQINEDIPFIYKALDNAKLLVKSNKYCYNYRMSQNSTTRNRFRKRDLDLIKVCEDLEECSKHKNAKIKQLIKEKRDRSDFSLLAKIAYYGVEEGNDFKEETENMLKNLKKNYWELMLTNMTFTRKIQLTCFAINYDFSKKAIKFLKKKLKR